MNIDQFNRKWDERLALFRRHVSAPWWAPGLIITPQLRGIYNTWLPIDEYLAGLAAVARHFLPDVSWMPRILRSPHKDACKTALPPPLSLPDLWVALPPQMAGKVTFEAPQLMPLLCALAAPPRYGTAAGRYPEQLHQIAQFAKNCQRPMLRYLDLACGTGEGTLEITELLHEETGRPVRAVGVTLEPLEAWMASGRHPSHPWKKLAFVSGEVHHPPFNTCFDLVTINGLIGGPMCPEVRQLETILAALDSLLTEDGRVGIASNFHSGYRQSVEIFRKMAEADDWVVSGKDSAMWLSNP